MRNKRPTEDEILTVMLNKQLIKYSLKIDDIREIPEWYSKYTMTGEEHAEWKYFCINTMIKNLGYSKIRAEKTFAWMDLCWGLRIEG